MHVHVPCVQALARMADMCMCMYAVSPVYTSLTVNSRSCACNGDVDVDVDVDVDMMRTDEQTPSDERIGTHTNTCTCTCTCTTFACISTHTQYTYMHMHMYIHIRMPRANGTCKLSEHRQHVQHAMSDSPVSHRCVTDSQASEQFCMQHALHMLYHMHTCSNTVHLIGTEWESIGASSESCDGVHVHNAGYSCVFFQVWLAAAAVGCGMCNDGTCTGCAPVAMTCVDRSASSMYSCVLMWRHDMFAW